MLTIYSELVKIQNRPFRLGVVYDTETNEVEAWIDTVIHYRYRTIWSFCINRSGELKTMKLHPTQIPDDVWRLLCDMCGDPVLKLMVLVLTVGEE